MTEVDDMYDLGGAWIAAEAALPRRHSLQLQTNGRGTYEARAVPPFMDYPEWHAALREAFGDTATEALRALAVALTTTPPTDT